MKLASGMCGVALALSAAGAWAQAGDAPAAPAKTSTEADPVRPKFTPFQVQSFYLGNVSAPNDSNEIQTALRNLLPSDSRLYLDASQNAIIVRAAPEDLTLAGRLIKDLDRPKKNFRLTYTITEMDGSKPVGTQHFAMIVESGQRITLKQGSKVPIATGSFNPGAGGGGIPAGAQTQFTYLDVGMNFDATPVEVGNGAVLKTKVEQSSVAEQISGVGLQDPIIRQSSLEGTSVLTLGKPLMLGSMDVPGSTRHLDVQVMLELVP
jgi:type II secretory pathway component GspD/PulD (secretin)